MEPVIEYAHDEKGHRIDVHRPSAINPGDYHYMGVSERRAALKAGQKIAGPGGICHHCGKAIVWEVNYRHIPTGNLVTFGYICAGILDMTDSRIDHEMTLLRRAAENEAKKSKFERTRADRFANFLAEYADEWRFIQDHADENGWLASIRRGVETYGSPFEDQIVKVQRYIVGYEKLIVAKLAEAKLLENAPELVEGRQHIVGTIVSTKVVNSDYGDTRKMLVRFDDGNKVFGTVPNDLFLAVDVDKMPGTRIEFDAKVEPKEDHFGFFSRPTKTQVV